MPYKLTNRLADCLKAKGISKSQLAYYLGLDRASVTRMERGDIRPSIETAFRIAAYFKKPVDEIFQLGKEDDKTIFYPCPAADRNNEQRRKKPQYKKCN